MAINYTLPQLLQAMMEQGASDLHLSTGTPPRLRISGSLFPLQLPALDLQDSTQLCYSILTEEQKKDFEQNRDIDLAFTVKGLARFRANIYMEKGSVAGAFRVIPFKIHTTRELGIPAVLEEACHRTKGLILVTGPTGSGKSTTLASLINYINENRSDHIVTIEDPVEFIHPHKRCVVNQREVGGDAKSFSRALRAALRQDPNVVMVGEMRDLETIQLALTTAETGHLVLGTLHTNSAISTLNRVIDVFPPHQQAQIRGQLAMNLTAVTSQMLVPTTQGGRALAMEIMIPNSAIRNLIREDKLHQIYSTMQTGQDESGMMTMNQSLFNLMDRRVIDKTVAFAKSPDHEELEKMLEKRSLKAGPPQKTQGMGTKRGA